MLGYRVSMGGVAYRALKAAGRRPKCPCVIDIARYRECQYRRHLHWKRYSRPCGSRQAGVPEHARESWAAFLAFVRRGIQEVIIISIGPCDRCAPAMRLLRGRFRRLVAFEINKHLFA